MKKYESLCGQDIRTTLREMIAIANESGNLVETVFNDDHIIVRPGDTVGALYDSWKKQWDRAYDESPEGRAQIAAREENARIIREEQSKPLAVFDVTNQPLWESFVETNKSEKSEYGAAVIRYAARWAALMEQRLKVSGATIATIADQTGYDADIEGITGFMYGAARSILIQVWKHGEELRLWFEASRPDWTRASEKPSEALEEPPGRFFDLSFEN